MILVGEDACPCANVFEAFGHAKVELLQHDQLVQLRSSWLSEQQPPCSNLMLTGCCESLFRVKTYRTQCILLFSPAGWLSSSFANHSSEQVAEIGCAYTAGSDAEIC